MGSGGKKQTQQQNYWNTQAQQQNAAITTVDPLEQAWRDKQKRVLDWEASKGKDIRNMPGMSEHIQIGQAAMDRANQERMGGSGLSLADPGASGYANQLKQLRQSQMGEAVGASLEDARAGIHAEAANSIMPLSQLSSNRRIAQAGHSGSMFGNWANMPRQQPWWQQLLGGAAQAASIYKAI